MSFLCSPRVIGPCLMIDVDLNFGFWVQNIKICPTQKDSKIKSRSKTMVNFIIESETEVILSENDVVIIKIYQVNSCDNRCIYNIVVRYKKKKKKEKMELILHSLLLNSHKFTK